MASGVDKSSYLFITADKNAIVSQPQMGHLYFFQYDPKHKDTLPYYDVFPLILCLGPVRKGEGFLGINFHYLPYNLRATLMDLLYPYVTDEKLSVKDYLKISYYILKASAANKFIKPTIKHYLPDHVRSKFIRVTPKEWDMALFTPVARFQKKSESYVWSESAKMVRGR
jgi:hypothetical protein